MSKALLRYIRLSPTKARLVAREVQGMNAEVAIASLEFTPNKAARVISKVIASAVANGGHDAQDVIITSCRVDAGPVLRRFMPRAKGRATPIRKPTAHIFVEVDTAKSQLRAGKTSKTGKDSGAKKEEVVTKARQDLKGLKKTTESKPKVSKTEAKPKAQASTKTKVEKTKTTSSEKKSVAKKKTEGEE